MDLGHEGVDIQQLAELFKVLGDPTRLRIVRLLLNSEMCVSDIAETMGMGQSAISHQLRVLRQARLVTFRKEGKTAWYSLNDEHVAVLLQQGIEHVSHQ
ncbi:MAG: winged helix-turn-helix transcriptional regulator [Veillonella sp.]|uniref:ArsR/SmtB family transcription factor n=1 Tax=Veillonella sp. TaxID=1926307 RepID=UPI0025F3F532|nr:metalloregulator ArsR/SmtB family transcription factor [Veillonella sp.]MBS4913452.1 winged helix-turn-helix transcriptional regulator [Veillonella sp.]